MSADWQEYRIEDVALGTPHAMSTGPFGSAISSKFFQEDGVPVIRGGNLSTNVSERMSDDGLVFVSNEKAQEFQRSVVRPGDLVFTCWGTINQVGLITSELKYPEYIISNKQMKLTPDPEKSDSLFLYYLFSSPIKQAEILSNAIGAAVPGFNLGQLKKHVVRLPHITEQRRIATVLGLFDQKIRHNSKINQTLEQMAQAIFKSWFVNFEPVKAKIKAKQNGQDPERAAMRTISSKTDEELDQLLSSQLEQLTSITALFPDELTDSELGLIPKGWKVKKIGDIIKRIPVGKKYSQKSASEKGYIPILDQGKSGIIGYHDDKPGVKASSGDPIIVFANHTCYMRLIMHDFSAIQNVLPFKGIDLDIYWIYAATYGKQEFVEYKGHWPDFAIKKVTVPTNQLDEKYGEYVGSFYKGIFRNESESLILEELRDTLLPKLLSGEIELKETA